MNTSQTLPEGSLFQPLRASLACLPPLPTFSTGTDLCDFNSFPFPGAACFPQALVEGSVWAGKRVAGEEAKRKEEHPSWQNPEHRFLNIVPLHYLLHR